MDSGSVASTGKRQRPYVPRVNDGGNYCGHSPEFPRLELVKPVTASDKNLPGILIELIERARRYYSTPNALPSLRNANRSAKGRQQRSERREACLVLLAAIIANTDLVSLRCGIPTRQGFMSLTLDYLVEFTGLNFRRAERAMADLQRANLLTVSQPRRMKEDGSWRGLAAVKAVNRLLFTAFGLGRRLQHERERAIKRLTKKIKKAGGTMTSWARNALVIGGILNPKVSSPKGNSEKPSEAAPDDPPAASLTARAGLRDTRPEQPPAYDEAYQRARMELLVSLKTANPEKTAAEVNAEADRIIQAKASRLLA